MSCQILAVVSQEPPLLRWLHSHDPDRDLTDDLLKSSATLVTSVPPSETAGVSDSPLPPTSSLFVPMYRRKQFILGQLYGPMSPNAMALNMLAQAGYGVPPVPVSRRFVVDLAAHSSLQFIEYEWLSDGKLCVSMHHITSEGMYDGESILLDSCRDPEADLVLSKNHLFSGNTKHRPSPTKVIMRLKFKQQEDCEAHDGSNVPSRLSDSRRANSKFFHQPTDWDTWLSALTRSRNGLAKISVGFSMATPAGNVEGAKSVLLRQDCELGVSPQSPRGSRLLKEFMKEMGMLLSHPSIDEVVRVPAERRVRKALTNTLSQEDGDQAPCLAMATNTGADISLPSTTGIVKDMNAFKMLGGSEMQNVLSCDGYAGDTVVVTSCKRGSPEHDNEKAKSTASILSSVGISEHIGCRAMEAENFVTAETEFEGSASLNLPGSAVESSRLVRHVLSTSRKKEKRGNKLLTCECGKTFSHKGHYNEHRMCVHEKVRQHKCTYPQCQRYVANLSHLTGATVRISEGLLTVTPNKLRPDVVLTLESCDPV